MELSVDVIFVMLLHCFGIKCRLVAVAFSIPNRSSVVPVVQPGLQERSLSGVVRSFYSSLFTLVMPDFERLRRPGTRADARRRTALLVAEVSTGTNEARQEEYDAAHT